MEAELVLDLHDLGDVIAAQAGRQAALLPTLDNIDALCRHLGIEITGFHLTVPRSIRGTGDEDTSFNGLLTKAWWQAEQALLDDASYSVSFHYFPVDAARAARDALTVTTALGRSDALANRTKKRIVVVMSERVSVSPAVTHARGVPVMLAGSVIPDPGLAHVRLDPDWLAGLNDRLAAPAMDGVELRSERPWRDGVALATPYGGFEGRHQFEPNMSQFAKSFALFDPTTFEMGIGQNSGAITPKGMGIASTIERLGLGELVHVEMPDADDELDDTTLVATLYQFAAAYPDFPITIVSTRPSLIAATSDLNTYSMPNPRRFIRLCVPERPITFDERVHTNDLGACRVVLESSQSASLFPDAGTEQQDQPTHDVSGSPILTLWSNPNRQREDVAEWRDKTHRRFLMIDADTLEASPADSTSGPVLPVALGGCTDFEARPPVLRAGSVVEGVLSADEQRWIVVSDPIERRHAQRSDSPDGTTSDSQSAPVQATAA